jgi:hypothetical protein
MKSGLHHKPKREGGFFMKSKFAEEKEVIAVPEPEWTDTWHPTSHKRVISAVTNTLEEKGLGARNKHYSLAGNGNNCFASWVLDQDTNGKSWMLGFRNSMNKSFALGFCAGVSIMVCSNMMFNGQFVEFQKHTSQLDDDRLLEMSSSTFNQIQPQIIELDTWHDKLAEFPMRSTRNFKALVYDAMASGAFPPSRFERFLQCHTEEMQIDPTRSLRTFHGAGTKLLRETSLFTNARSNESLTLVCDDYMERMAA